jgi:hypothetical protein
MLRALVTLAMFFGSGQLFASPIYAVSIDSRGLSGQGYLDFLFLGTASSARASVKLTNFTGDFDKSTATISNAEGSLDAGVTIHNDTGWNEFGQLANFGGLFTFHVQFDVTDDATGGSTLSIALLAPDLIDYADGTTGDLANFEVSADQAISFLVGDRSAAALVKVPEPATLAHIALGMILLVVVLRGRRR